MARQQKQTRASRHPPATHAAAEMECFPVSKLVNSPQNESEQCVVKLTGKCVASESQNPAANLVLNIRGGICCEGELGGLDRFLTA
jgi:hypothetical protein